MINTTHEELEKFKPEIQKLVAEFTTEKGNTDNLGDLITKHIPGIDPVTVAGVVSSVLVIFGKDQFMNLVALGMFLQRRAGYKALESGYAKLIRSGDFLQQCSKLPTLKEQLEYVASVIEA